MLYCSQLSVIAKDLGNPAGRSPIKVTVNIARNPAAPVFSQRNYEVTINENVPRGFSVISISATDNDGVSTNNQ